MKKNTIIFVIVAALGGAGVGFWLANSINRSAVTSTNPQQSAPAPASAKTPDADEVPDLTSDELKAKLAEADQNANNFDFQKKLGVALSRYAAMKQDVKMLADAVRILDRANALKPGDLVEMPLE